MDVPIFEQTQSGFAWISQLRISMGSVLRTGLQDVGRGSYYPKLIMHAKNNM
jgi:hypothetical protein